MADEGLIDADEAVRRVTGAQLAQLLFPRFDPTGRARAADHRRSAPLPAPRPAGSRSPRPTAAAWAALRRRRRPGAPRDQPRRPARHDRGARGADRRGGKTSHAAVVARGMGRTCVCGAEQLEIDTERGEVRVCGPRPSSKVTWSRSTAPPARCSWAPSRSPTRWSCATSRDGDGRASDSDLVDAVDVRASTAPTRVRRLEVRANADTAEDAARARRFGAAGHRPVPDRAHVPGLAPRSWSSR